MANVADIKKELQLLGISTATPGLVGEERYEELKSRLEEAQSEHHKSQLLEFGNTIAKSNQHSIAHESLGHLSIAELRSRLNSLGISSATPGLIGEDRWNELMKRLMVAICGTEETSHHNTKSREESRENGNTMQQNISKSRKPPEENFTLKERLEENIKGPEIRNNQISEQSVFQEDEVPMENRDESNCLSTINELKKQIKRISNKRAIYIAGKLSGINQDEKLRGFGDMLSNMDADIVTCKGLQQRGEIKIQVGSLKHRLSGTGTNKAFVFIDETLAQLEYRKEDIKREINIRRSEIKLEADDHPEFGIDVEENLKIQINQLSLHNSKVSRARMKIVESKAIDLAVESTLPSAVDSIITMPLSKDVMVFAEKEHNSNKVVNHSDSNFPEKSEISHSLSVLSKGNDTAVVKYDSIRVDENISVKYRMGIDRPPPPKGPPPRSVSQESEEDDDDEESTDNAESDSDKEEITSEFEAPIHPSLPAENDGVEILSTPNVEMRPPSDEDDDTLMQIKVLRDHAKTLEKLDDILAAEVLHERALELDPTDILTLQGFAVFLHRKKGEVARAEAFFGRALQICLPSLHSNLVSPSKKKQEGFGDVALLSFRPDGQGSPVNSSVHAIRDIVVRDEKVKLRDVVLLLLTFANFLEKAKGDAEGAAMLLHKAILLAPDDSFALATVAHFSTLHRGVCKELSISDTDSLFRKALRLDPKNTTFMMWYGKFLKNTKKLGPAELMYRSAVDVSAGDKKNEPTSLCNYATFLFKHKKNVVKASELFLTALERFPDHKGLRKNYSQLVKVIEKKQVVSNKNAKSSSAISQTTGANDSSKLEDLRSVDLMTPSLPPPSTTGHSSTRGSRRAQRMSHSIVERFPSELESAESKTQYILSQLSSEPYATNVARKLELHDANESGIATGDIFQAEGFSTLDSSVVGIPQSQFLQAVSPSQSFRELHPQIKYYDEDETVDGQTEED